MLGDDDLEPAGSARRMTFLAAAAWSIALGLVGDRRHRSSRRARGRALPSIWSTSSRAGWSRSRCFSSRCSACTRRSRRSATCSAFGPSRRSSRRSRRSWGRSCRRGCRSSTTPSTSASRWDRGDRSPREGHQRDDARRAPRSLRVVRRRHPPLRGALLSRDPLSWDEARSRGGARRAGVGGALRALAHEPAGPPRGARPRAARGVAARAEREHRARRARERGDERGPAGARADRERGAYRGLAGRAWRAGVAAGACAWVAAFVLARDPRAEQGRLLDA